MFALPSASLRRRTQASVSLPVSLLSISRTGLSSAPVISSLLGRDATCPIIQDWLSVLSCQNVKGNFISVQLLRHCIRCVPAAVVLLTPIFERLRSCLCCDSAFSLVSPSLKKSEHYCSGQSPYVYGFSVRNKSTSESV